MIFIVFPVLRSQSLIVLSVLPEAINDECGMKTRLVISLVCPERSSVRLEVIYKR